jgi:molybdopterin-guanine dinucleotide biosynthesis protein A
MILAGGRGQRLGGCVKPLLSIGGATILERQRAVFAQLGVVPTLVGPADTPLDGVTELAIVHDEVAAAALGGLYTALRAAPKDPVAVVAGDMPFVTAAMIEGLLRQLGPHDAAIPRGPDGWHPLCAVYRRRVVGHLRSCIDAGNWRVTRAIEGIDVVAVGPEDLAAMGADEMGLFNVNTPEDIRRAEHHAATLAAPAS